MSGGGLRRTVYCHPECGRAFSGAYRDVMAQLRLHKKFCSHMAEYYPRIANTPMSPYVHTRRQRPNDPEWNTAGTICIQDDVVSRSGTAVGGGSSRVPKPAPAPAPEPAPAPAWIPKPGDNFIERHVLTGQPMTATDREEIIGEIQRAQRDHRALVAEARRGNSSFILVSFLCCFLM